MVTAELTPVAGIPLDVVELRLKRRESAWTQMVTTAHSIGAVSEPEVVLAALAHRERWGSTALGKGCALADHAVSVARRVTFLVTGDYDTVGDREDEEDSVLTS